MRIGVDVGGTNTDAVLMDGPKVLALSKSPTTPDIGSGIVAAVREVLEQGSVSPDFGGALGLVLVASLAAAYPARRAARIDPVRVLRGD